MGKITTQNSNFIVAVIVYHPPEHYYDANYLILFHKNNYYW